MPLNIKSNLTLKPGVVQQPHNRSGGWRPGFNQFATWKRGCERRTGTEKRFGLNGLWARENDVICLTPSKADSTCFMPPRLPRALLGPVPTTVLSKGDILRKGQFQVNKGTDSGNYRRRQG